MGPKAHMIVGLAFIATAWKLTESSFATASIAGVNITIYHGLFVVGGLVLLRGFFKWVSD